MKDNFHQSKSKLFLTGASGFIGKALLTRLASDNYVIAPVRTPFKLPYLNVDMPVLADISSITKDSIWFHNCDAVLHLAAQAHVQTSSLAEFSRINTDATLNLAMLAAEAGVKRFIFLSTIGVHGINNTKPFCIDDLPAPVEHYSISKFQAEIGLRKIAEETGMEVVIIRPPLVYGPDAPGNFGKLAKLAKKNLPLPFGAINNQRSLVALDNLIDLLVVCITHPKAANQTFLVSDDQDITTTELLQMLTRAAGKRPWLLPIPIQWLKFVTRIVGKQAVIDRMTGNLQVDISHTMHTLNWRPPFTVEEGIKKCFNSRVE